MKKTSANPFLGLRTVIYNVRRLDEAKAWYASALGIKPYFDQPFYVGFNVRGYELGLHPGKPGPAKKDCGSVAYWGVEDASKTFKRLLKHGAKPQMDVQDVGGGIRVATVVDPFGNVFGIIENPHFKLPRK